MRRTGVEPMVLEIDDLCDVLCIGKNTAYELLNSGEIDGFKVGSCWKIPRKAVEQYIERKCDEGKKKKEMCTYIKNENR